MTNDRLARSYLKKANDRIDILEVLFNKGAFSDVTGEAQECVELALKGMLRFVGIEPPKIHDVGNLLLEYNERFPEDVRSSTPELARISKRLRKETELSFYGDKDFIPTEEYSKEDAKEALDDAKFVLEIANKLLG